MSANSLVSFYRFWRGRLGLKGAGLALRLLAPVTRGLQRYPLVLPEGHVVHIDFTDVSAWYWINHLLGDRLEERGLLQAMKHAARPGDVVWDVGANAGLLSYLLVRSLPSCAVVFFEPNPAVYAIASEALAPFAQAKGVPVGLSSDSKATARMVVPQGGSTVGSLGGAPAERASGGLTVRLARGDELIERGEIPAPNVIKIDTEGHEAEVLAGLGRTIARLRPKIFFEHISLSDAQVSALVPQGYDIFSVSDRSGETRPGFDRRRGHNSALLPCKSRQEAVDGQPTP